MSAPAVRATIQRMSPPENELHAHQRFLDGEAAMQGGDWARATELFTGLFVAESDLDPYLHASAACSAGACLRRQGDFTGARRWLETAREHPGADADLLNRIAGELARVRLGQLD